MKTHARVRWATSKTAGSVVKARVFFPTPRSAHFVIYVVDKGIWVAAYIPRSRLGNRPIVSIFLVAHHAPHLQHMPQAVGS